jgi:FixJ family two-component response regulator
MLISGEVLVEDGRALVAAAKTLQPDVIVADITMPYLNGIEAMAQLKKDNARVKVVFLTMHQDPAYARRALDAGAAGFVVKYSAPAELVMAVCAALKGQTFITPTLASDVFRQAQHASGEMNSPARTLTPRQREILQLLAEGPFSQGNCPYAGHFAAHCRISQISAASIAQRLDRRIRRYIRHGRNPRVIRVTRPCDQRPPPGRQPSQARRWPVY